MVNLIECGVKGDDLPYATAPRMVPSKKLLSNSYDLEREVCRDILVRGGGGISSLETRYQETPILIQ